jgi:hypothetical protein
MTPINPDEWVPLPAGMRLPFLRKLEMSASIDAMQLFKNKADRMAYFGSSIPLCPDGYPLQYIGKSENRRSRIDKHFSENQQTVSEKITVQSLKSSSPRRNFQAINRGAYSPYAIRLPADKWPFTLYRVTDADDITTWLAFGWSVEDAHSIFSHSTTWNDSALPDRRECLIDRCDIHIMATLEACEALAYGIALAAQAGGFVVEIHKGFNTTTRQNIVSLLDVMPVEPQAQDKKSSSVLLFEPAQIQVNDGSTIWGLRVFYYDCTWPASHRTITVVDHLKTNAVTLNLAQYDSILNAIGYLENVGLGDMMNDIIPDTHVEELSGIGRRIKTFKDAQDNLSELARDREERILLASGRLHKVARKFNLSFAKKLIAVGCWLENKQNQKDDERMTSMAPEEIVVTID